MSTLPPERNDLIREHYKKSNNYAATGRVFNISRQRVEQIVKAVPDYPH